MSSISGSGVPFYVSFTSSSGSSNKAKLSYMTCYSGSTFLSTFFLTREGSCCVEKNLFF